MTPAGVVVLTDRRQARAPLSEVVTAAASGGARWVLLREKDLPKEARAELAGSLRQLVERLIVAGPDLLDGDAVHLAATEPLPSGPVLIGRSCHNQTELDRLTTEDYVTVSPVFPSASKPGYGPALGLSGLRELCSRSERPVLALGGVDSPARAADCVAAGAAGVAVMGAVMRADDPGEFVARLREAVEG